MEVKKFTESFHEEDDDKANIREILPQMVSASNNSRLTQQVANTLVEKLTKNEIRDFKEWLKLVDSACQMKVNKHKFF